MNAIMIPLTGEDYCYLVFLALLPLRWGRDRLATASVPCTSLPCSRLPTSFAFASSSANTEGLHRLHSPCAAAKGKKRAQESSGAF